MSDITPSTSALLLLDLQNEMVDPKGKVGAHGLAGIVAEAGVLEHASSALKAARTCGMTVAHVRLGFRPDHADCLSVAARIDALKKNKAAILGEWGTEFPDVVKPADDEVIFTKQCVNPFFNTGLMTWLMQRGIKSLYLSGVATNLVVEATARAGDDAGFAINVLGDACASPNAEWHAFAVEKMLPVFGSVMTTNDFVEACRA
ncbi:isochorismatase hydrolase [Hyphomonas adhaerens MHS-3]|uniref:Isochorismatase hydrolase n=1 Tax=Hyphomonas adhaerens MHS-3 TaxID=1280949 RepID=A0A069E7I1_9PROT|nr:cysteine hydrolase family protein [Hyphomonas adhaerens]KCZ86027.1 isochorismatase hydrolase [Hyphomonas adhaerens MHS-3]